MILKEENLIGEGPNSKVYRNNGITGLRLLGQKTIVHNLNDKKADEIIELWKDLQ